MRNIAHKIDTLRTATAGCRIRMSGDTVKMVQEGRVPKGDPLPLARVAAIMGAKKTSELIPYCHPLLIDAASVDFEFLADGINVTVTVTAVAKTGVEMEALTAASLAALTLYDMLKPVDDDLEILSCRLLEKKGGKSGLPAGAPEGLKASVVVVSDSAATGTRDDVSGELIVDRLREFGVDGAEKIIVADEADQIEAALRGFVERGVGLVLTTGGTGFSPRDRTTEATRRVIEREAPGIAEAMRAYGQRRTPYSMLSGGVAGVAGRTVIVNFPGSPGGVLDSFSAIFPALFHVFGILDGEGH